MSLKGFYAYIGIGSWKNQDCPSVFGEDWPELLHSHTEACHREARSTD